MSLWPSAAHFATYLTRAYDDILHLQATDKTLVHPKAMWHSLVKEKGNAELLKQTIAWMEERC